MRRDLGRREDRQKTRLMWLVEEMGVEAYREEVGRRMGVKLRTGAHVEVLDDWFPTCHCIGGVILHNGLPLVTTVACLAGGWV